MRHVVVEGDLDGVPECGVPCVLGGAHHRGDLAEQQEGEEEQSQEVALSKAGCSARDPKSSANRNGPDAIKRIVQMQYVEWSWNG